MKHLIIIFLFFSLDIYADEKLFLKANNYYNLEQYDDAIILYDSLITQGFKHHQIYLNIGNCFYQKKDWKNAIWNYEKSLKIKKSQIAKENLSIAKLNIIDKVEPIPLLFYKRWWENIYSYLTTLNWQIFCLLSIWILVILKIINQFFNFNFSKLIQNFLMFISLILFLISYSSLKNSFLNNEGIIFKSVVEVYSAPTDQSTDLFTLHSGTKIKVLDQINGWVNIRIANGETGWIKLDSYKKL